MLRWTRYIFISHKEMHISDKYLFLPIHISWPNIFYILQGELFYLNVARDFIFSTETSYYYSAIISFHFHLATSHVNRNRSIFHTGRIKDLSRYVLNRMNEKFVLIADQNSLVLQTQSFFHFSYLLCASSYVNTPVYVNISGIM